ncbi:hypothetical protein P7C71_g716, partial [Lecanoromycetidae sp. Uapishka_2]
MPTRTIYTDAYMVVIDIGTPPSLSPWLEETTYLMDGSGHTTAIVAQTDQPTAGVILQPIPFTPANQQALQKTSATERTTGLPTVTAPPHTTPIPTIVAAAKSTDDSITTNLIAKAGAGAAVGLLVTAVLIYLLRRRSQRKRRRIASNLEDDHAWEDEKAGSRYLFDSWDTLGMAQSARLEEKSEREHHGLKSMEEVAQEYKVFNSMTDRDRGALREENEHEGTPRLEDAESGSSITLAGSPGTSLQKETSGQVRDFTDQGMIQVRAGQQPAQPAQPARPAPILKRPARGIREAAQGKFENEQAQAVSPKFVNTAAKRVKRGVRWVEEKPRIIIVDRWIGRRSVASWFGSSDDGRESEA